MKIIAFFLIVLAALPVYVATPYRAEPYHDAATCSQSDVEDAMLAATHTNDIVRIPAGDCTWLSTFVNNGATGATIGWAPPVGASIECAGDFVLGTPGNDGDTIIRDGFNRSADGDQSILQISVQSTGVFSIYGCTFDGESLDFSDRTNIGAIVIDGSLDSQVSIHHNDCNFIGNNCFHLRGHPQGVAWENTLQVNGGYPFKATGNGDGDDTWAEDTGYGGPRFFFMEDNIVGSFQDQNGGSTSDANGGDTIIDSFNGAKWVARRNILSCSGVQSHSIAAASRARGTRAQETYQNDATNESYGCFLLNPTPNPFAFLYTEGGGVLMWGNNIGTGRYQLKGTMYIERAGDHNAHGAYNTVPPDSFSYCMPGPLSGVVSTGAIATIDGLSTVTITRVSGSNFDTDWYDHDTLTGGTSPNANSVIIYINGKHYQFKTVTSTTVAVVTQMSTYPSQGGSLSEIDSEASLNWEMGSNIDEHSIDNTGGRCIDGPGNGKGGWLRGSFPNVYHDINADGDYDAGVDGISSSADWWPDQRLEPIYEWLNVGTCTSGFCSAWLDGGSINGGVIVENYNYYLYNSAGTTSGTNQTVGVRSGTIANRPGTCTAGTMYWATDEGEWDSTNGATPDGKSYICEASNTWTASYGAVGNGNSDGLPYDYPHPVREGGEPPPAGGDSSGRMRLR